MWRNGVQRQGLGAGASAGVGVGMGVGVGRKGVSHGIAKHPFRFPKIRSGLILPLVIVKGTWHCEDTLHNRTCSAHYFAAPCPKPLPPKRPYYVMLHCDGSTAAQVRSNRGNDKATRAYAVLSTCSMWRWVDPTGGKASRRQNACRFCTCSHSAIHVLSCLARWRRCFSWIYREQQACRETQRRQQWVI